MNSHLIPVFTADSQQLLCNARDLHDFLEVGRRFTTWIQERIEQYEFEEGLDFIVHKMQPGMGHKTASQNGEALESITYAENFGQQGRVEYHLTLDMAKELAMIENNAMGRRVRRYFIQRERQAIELLQQQATEVQPIEQVRKRIKDTPKFRYLLILQEQSRTLARELARCDHPRERFNLHCALRQVNNTIGIPTEPLEVWEGSQQRLSLSHQ
ncbi:antA/AntB antirepressor family protein [Halomonas llamarensis]|uniref:AntA/AntB antirepressor family protein n=1 Tax=Halomonas llamarensis TaxID=2945104 RepID=A0ABT0SRP3_9GAMM|nr:antA/AntB antirepressor family protein [Halomonas llamarensis]MCL7930467.1 antA/AntB antirepressor family protein [Halomonas llamarensis]